MNYSADQYNKLTSTELNTPIGLLALFCQSGKLIKIEYRTTTAFTKATEEPCLTTASQQIKQYFLDPTISFQIPFLLIGTQLQKAIWHEISTIPCGKTLTYGQLAKRLQTHPRVIGNACRANPIPIIVPCHRIVGANGIGGYMGHVDHHIKLKHWLLTHEMSVKPIKD